jgi:nucleotide-binding universal stress UspA family protein
MLQRVLVTLDGSELSEKALGYAERLVAPGSRIILLTVVDMPDISAYSLYPMAVSMDYYTDALTQAEQGAIQYIESEAETLRGKGFEVDTIVATGIAAESIVERAKALEVDAIVMSTHGRSGFNQWLFGSVTQKVMSMMPCPVFVVPGRLNASDKLAEATTAASDGSD